MMSVSSDCPRRHATKAAGLAKSPARSCSYRSESSSDMPDDFEESSLEEALEMREGRRGRKWEVE